MDVVSEALVSEKNDEKKFHRLELEENTSKLSTQRGQLRLGFLNLIIVKYKCIIIAVLLLINILQFSYFIMGKLFQSENISSIIGNIMSNVLNSTQPDISEFLTNYTRKYIKL